MSPTLTVNEIYESIQGESTWAGLRCVFVRLTFCDLRCTYCDTAYAFYKGDKRPVGDVLADVLCASIARSWRSPVVSRFCKRMSSR